jgi:hypothetical protein
MEDQLTPAEAALLLKPRRGTGSNCLQCALLALLAKGHVSIEEGGGVFNRKRLLHRNGDGTPLPPHHVVVKNAIFPGGKDPASADEVVSALHKAFGYDHAHYVHDHVAPALVAKGLITRSERKWLGLIPYINYEHTVEGRTRAQRIEGLLDELAQMKSLMRDSPDRARRLLEAAGILVVLSPHARAEARRLRDMVQQGGDGTLGVTYSGEGSTDWQIGVDVGDLGDTPDCLDLLDGISCASDFTEGGSGDGSGDGGGCGGD